jgi:hypothetical protein
MKSDLSKNSAPLEQNIGLLDYVRGDGGKFKFFKLQKREKRKGEGREYLIHTELICTIFSTSNSQ